MIEELKKYTKNRHIDAGECRKLLGDDAKVSTFAAFWRDHGEELGMIVFKALYDFTQDENFNKDELILFKRGLAEIPLFFENCFKEKISLTENLNDTTIASGE